VTSISYSVDGAAPQTYSGPFTVSGTGQHPVTYWATDAAGNVEATHTGWVNISNPYTTVTNLAANNHSGWHKSTTTVTITGSGDSSPFTIHYKVDAGSWQSVPSAASVVVSGQGSHTVAFYAVNSVSASSVHQTGYVNIDLTRPTTTATGLQANNHSGWRTTSRTVTFAATDALSGVAHTYYKLGSGSQQTYAGTPVQISGQGSHAVTYWSVDAAGNIETSLTGYVNIDTTPPTVTSSADGAWHNSPVTVKLNATDALSGVASTQYRAQGSSTWTVAAGNAFVVPAPANGSNDGAHVYQYRALDQAGNASATGTCTVRVDTQGPTVTNDADPYWHNSAVTVHLAAADANAGVASVSYRLTGTTSWTTTSGATAQITVPVPADGQPHRYSYDYQATDKAGNLSAVKTLVVLIDPSMPNTTVAGLPAKPWTNMPVSLTFTATSGAGAPIVRTEYSMNGGTSWTTFTAGTPLVISQPGVTTVLYRSVNAAGTTENPARQAVVRIDVGKPICVALKNVTVKRGKKVKLRYRVKDPSPSCGFAKVKIMIYRGKRIVKRITIANAKTNVKLTYRFKVKLKKGKYKWKVKATDIAGNVQAKIGGKRLRVK
jgi:hypothetical protein